MDVKREKQLRKDSFAHMARHMRVITGSPYLRLSQIMEILKVTRPTARRFAESLVNSGKAHCYSDMYEPIEIVVDLGAYTEKEMERAERAYKDLIWEITE